MSTSSVPVLWVIAGPNGAGKTSLFNRSLRDKLPFINADEIAVELGDGVDGASAWRAGRLAVERREAALEKGEAFSVETTLAGKSGLVLMESAKAQGYRVNLVYVGIDSAELSADRVTQRMSKGGHGVPLAAIVRRYPVSLANLRHALKLCDRAYVLDSSSEERRLLLMIEGGRARYIGSDLPEWLTRAVPLEMRRFDISRQVSPPSREF